MNKFDSEEKEIFDLRRSENASQKIEQHQAIAEATFKKDARINIRLSSRDLRSLQGRDSLSNLGIECLA